MSNCMCATCDLAENCWEIIKAEDRFDNKFCDFIDSDCRLCSCWDECCEKNYNDNDKDEEF